MVYPNGGKFKKEEKQEKMCTFAFCESARTLAENFGCRAHGVQVARRGMCIRVWRVQGVSDPIVPALKQRIPSEIRS